GSACRLRRSPLGSPARSEPAVRPACSLSRWIPAALVPGPACGPATSSSRSTPRRAPPPPTWAGQFRRGSPAPPPSSACGVRPAPLPVRVKLGEEPDASQLSIALAKAKRLLGIEAAALTPTMGVVAADVEAASPAERAGLEPGDILREVNHQPLRTLADFEALAQSLDAHATVLILVQRADVALYVAVEPRR